MVNPGDCADSSAGKWHGLERNLLWKELYVLTESSTKSGKRRKDNERKVYNKRIMK